MVANGIIMSQIIYLIQAWGGCSDYLIAAIQVIQNRAARLVTKLDWYTSTSTLLNQCGWLSVRQLIIYHSLLMIFKIKTDKKPVYFHQKISKQFNYKTRFASDNSVKIDQQVKKEISQQKFLYKFSKQWNELPSEIKHEQNVKQFKVKLKLWVRSNVPVK